VNWSELEALAFAILCESIYELDHLGKHDPNSLPYILTNPLAYLNYHPNILIAVNLGKGGYQ
jgi:hypothetical protein